MQCVKQKQGRAIWLCGGGNWAGQLLAAGLIDEVVRKVNLVLFGGGLPLFGEHDRQIDNSPLAYKNKTRPMVR